MYVCNTTITHPGGALSSDDPSSLLVHPKDHMPMDERKGVVYSISCTVCLKVYIVQAGRSLKHRLKEH